LTHEPLTKSIAALEIPCPNCGNSSKLSDLIYYEITAFTNQFICFVAIMEELNQNMIEKVERYIGTKFNIIYSSI
jgi:hypothetical protein